MKILKLFFILAVLSLMTACTKDLITDTPDDNLNELKCAKLNLKIAVVSDLHYLSPSLMLNGAANGQAFQTYLLADPKLIEYSKPIFDKVISELFYEKPDIVLIPGDLTKDGEKVSHEMMAKMLRQLSRRSIQVFVIPGNHDINNPTAMGYDGDNSFTTPSIAANEFANIYADFGYKHAIYRDPNSLSYICKLSKDLWLLGIDDCKYENNVTSPETSGKIKPETMTWIQTKIAVAKKEKITVLAMMHHGIVEHYTGQNQIDPGYVTDNWQENADLLMDAGLSIMFTGHYHANDICMRSTNGKYLYDIETGSLVTPPSPYRIINFKNGQLNISTNHVESINSQLPGGMDFITYSNLFLTNHLDGYFTYVLNNVYGVPNDESNNYLAAKIAPQFRNAIMAHFAGDEKITPEEQAVDDWIGANVSPVLAGALQGIWTDLPPKDNEIQLSVLNY